MFSPNSKKVNERLQKRGELWLKGLEQISDEQMTLKKTSKEWCLAELYDHVIRVARSYQIPNYENAKSGNGRYKKKKNNAAFLVFNMNYIPKRKIVMENFPSKIVEDFTPVIRGKEGLKSDFLKLIQDVSEMLQEGDSRLLKKSKHHHPFFGHISALEWLSLVEIHLRHHEDQRNRIIEFAIEQP